MASVPCCSSLSVGPDRKNETIVDTVASDDTVQHLVSFVGYEHLCRGVRLAKVMKGGGRIFANSKRCAKSYELSDGVSNIDFFISHNWVIPRPVTYVALAFKFNMHLAVAAGFVVLVLGSILGMFGVIPTMESALHDYPIGYLCRLTTVPVFLLTLLFGGHIKAWWRPDGDPVAFLDKACIHQTDQDLLEAGVSRLGAFLRVSDKMLVLLSGVYLRKLWTVYEVASFLSLHDTSKLDVVPLMLPFSFTLFIVLVYPYQYLVLMQHAIGLPDWTLWAANTAGSLVYFYCLRLWARSKVDLEAIIANFSVYNSVCAVESDREIVYTNIAALQKACGRVSRNATLEESLQAFDQHVRTSLTKLFNDVFGRFSYTHSEYIAVAMACAAATHADYWAEVGAGQPWREAIGLRCMDAALDWMLIPIWALVIEVVAGRYLSCKRHGCKDIAYIFWGNLLTSCFGNGCQERHLDSNLPTPAFIGKVVLEQTLEPSDTASFDIVVDRDLMIGEDANFQIRRQFV